jgi:hypothetical protein
MRAWIDGWMDRKQKKPWPTMPACARLKDELNTRFFFGQCRFLSKNACVYLPNAAGHSAKRLLYPCRKSRSAKLGGKKSLYSVIEAESASKDAQKRLKRGKSTKNSKLLFLFEGERVKYYLPAKAAGMRWRMGNDVLLLYRYVYGCVLYLRSDPATYYYYCCQTIH